jgi:hypothetical protein
LRTANTAETRPSWRRSRSACRRSSCMLGC